MYYIYFINEIKFSNFFKKQSKCLKCSSISEQIITNLRIKFFVAIVFLFFKSQFKTSLLSPFY